MSPSSPTVGSSRGDHPAAGTPGDRIAAPHHHHGTCSPPPPNGFPARLDSVATARASRPLPFATCEKRRGTAAKRLPGTGATRRTAAGPKGDLHIILPALFVVNGPLSQAPLFRLALMMMGSPDSGGGGCNQRSRADERGLQSEGCQGNRSFLPPRGGGEGWSSCPRAARCLRSKGSTFATVYEISAAAAL